MVIRTRCVLAGALVALALSACGGTGGGAVVATPGQTTGAGVPAQATVDPVPGSDQNDDEKDADEPETVIQPGDSKAPDHGPTLATGAAFQMPDVRGMDLQDAQDLLQGRKSYKLEQKDALGRGRNPGDDRDWKVCSQSPAAGRSVSVEAVVRLSAVKDGEKCP